MGRRGLALAAMLSGCAIAITACGGVAASVPAELLAGEISLVAGTAETNNAAKDAGDFALPESGEEPEGEVAEKTQRWVGLTVGSGDGLDGFVTNAKGLTYYRFDKDSNDPPTSNCTGQCAKTWPKVLLGEDSRLFLDSGIDSGKLGAIPAGDGKFQLTIGGWPVYRFSKDKKAGDVNGQGVDGTWFAVAPDGSKVGGDEGAGKGRNSAASITLFDEPGLDGADAAQGVSSSQADDTGCVEIPRGGVASSVQAEGSYTLWDGADCKGKSVQLTGDVEDLDDENFDDAAESVRLAAARD